MIMVDKNIFCSPYPTWIVYGINIISDLPEVNCELHRAGTILMSEQLDKHGKEVPSRYLERCRIWPFKQLCRIYGPTKLYTNS